MRHPPIPTHCLWSGLVGTWGWGDHSARGSWHTCPFQALTVASMVHPNVLPPTEAINRHGPRSRVGAQEWWRLDHRSSRQLSLSSSRCPSCGNVGPDLPQSPTVQASQKSGLFFSSSFLNTVIPTPLTRSLPLSQKYIHTHIHIRTYMF